MGYEFVAFLLHPLRGLLTFCRDGRLPFMTRLPKKRGITQVEGDKSLILRQKVHLKTIPFPRLPA